MNKFVLATVLAMAASAAGEAVTEEDARPLPGTTNDWSVTSSGMGTLKYMSPEQAKGKATKEVIATTSCRHRFHANSAKVPIITARTAT